MQLFALFVSSLVACSGSADTPTTDAVTQDPNTPGFGTVAQDVVVPEGTGVVLSGTFAYAGSSQGGLRIDILRAEPDGTPPLLKALTLTAQGPWSVELPKDTGPIIIDAFVDVGGLGPGHGEPSVKYHGVTLGSDPVSGIDLVLVDGGTVVGTPLDAPTLPTTPPIDGSAPPLPDGMAVPAGETPDATGEAVAPGTALAAPTGTAAPAPTLTPAAAPAATATPAAPAKGDAPK